MYRIIVKHNMERKEYIQNTYSERIIMSERASYLLKDAQKIISIQVNLNRVLLMCDSVIKSLDSYYISYKGVNFVIRNAQITKIMNNYSYTELNNINILWSVYQQLKVIHEWLYDIQKVD